MHVSSELAYETIPYRSSIESIELTRQWVMRCGEPELRISRWQAIKGVQHHDWIDYLHSIKKWCDSDNPYSVHFTPTSRSHARMKHYCRQSGIIRSRRGGGNGIRRTQKKFFFG
jgi:hypothetical protein